MATSIWLISSSFTLSFCNYWVFAVTFMMCTILHEALFYTLILILEAKLQITGPSSRYDVFSSHLLTTFYWGHMKRRKCKAFSIFRKTINHFQVHGSSICWRSCFFLNSVALRCQRLPCKAGFENECLYVLVWTHWIIYYVITYSAKASVSTQARLGFSVALQSQPEPWPNQNSNPLSNQKTGKLTSRGKVLCLQFANYSYTNNWSVISDLQLSQMLFFFCLFFFSFSATAKQHWAEMLDSESGLLAQNMSCHYCSQGLCEKNDNTLEQTDHCGCLEAPRKSGKHKENFLKATICNRNWCQRWQKYTHSLLK